MGQVALYGGSFDPPHLGHVLTATYVLCATEVDEVRLIPTFQHPFGKEMSPFALRCEMARAAIAHLGPRVIVDPIEEELGGVSYTVDTVNALRTRHPGTDILWVGGADTWRDRHQWKDWEQLEQLVTPYIVGREGVPTPEGIDVQTTLPDISSTAIREAISENRWVDHLVPPQVMTLIARHGLYR